MASRLLEDLHPAIASKVAAALASCHAAGLDVLVTCTWRSGIEQNDLYAQGRTRPGSIVTWAKAGESAHNFMVGGKPASLGVDIVPVRYGKPIWGLKGNGIDNDPTDDNKDDLELWQRVRSHFEAQGLKSASRWEGGKAEWPHFESPDTKQIMGRV